MDERNKEIYIGDIGVSERNFWRMGKNEVKDKPREMNDKRWQEEIQRKSSLKIYEEEKKEIKEELMYDNRPSSEIMYRARANCLKLNDRNRHQRGEVGCKLYVVPV